MAADAFGGVRTGVHAAAHATLLAFLEKEQVVRAPMGARPNLNGSALGARVSGGLGAGATTAVETDSTDMTWILLGMVLMAFLYVMTGVCTHLDLPESRETLAERYAHALSDRWPNGVMEVFQNSLPALSTKFLGQTCDTPLLVPLAPLEAKDLLNRHSAWSVDILTSSKALLFTATLIEDEHAKPNMLKIITRGEVVASVDKRLTIFNGKGEPFGRLVQEPSGEWALEEASSGRSRWAVSAKQEGDSHDLSQLFMMVTWRPKGQLLATAIQGPRRDGKRSDYLKVTNGPGVDMILALASFLGVVAFDIAPRLADRKRSLRGAVDFLEEQASGIASQLLGRLKH